MTHEGHSKTSRTVPLDKLLLVVCIDIIMSILRHLTQTYIRDCQLRLQQSRWYSPDHMHFGPNFG